MSINQQRLAAFKKNLDKFAKQIPATLAKEAQASFASRAYGSFKWYNPVLTGHSRHNWIVSINEQWREEVEGVYKEDGDTHDPLTGEEKLHWDTMRRAFMSLPLGQTIWICNNAPYIERLEDGYSQKAPQGMVKVTLNSLLEQVNAKVLPGSDKL